MMNSSKDFLTSNSERPRILIIGGGFGGLSVAKGLAKTDADVFLVDKRNYHLFQPLLYQVATAALAPGEIAHPIREVFRNQTNVMVALGELVGADLANKKARFARVEIEYDYLVLAAGATHSYFGNDDWQKIAPGLKTLEDALEIRRRVLLAFEEAEWEADDAAREAKLTFVIVGGGPTGVELAGAIKEIAAQSIPKDFRFVDTTTTKVILIQSGKRLLPALPDKLSQRALRDLQRLGVEVRLGSRVTKISDKEILIGEERLAAENIIWAAGVQGMPLARNLGVDLDAHGRILVGPDCAIPEHPTAFVIGDLAHFQDQGSGETLPGVAQVAVQMGCYVAGVIDKELENGGAIGDRPAFCYHDRGSMATIGRDRAVAAIGRWNFTGIFAWVLWCFVHVMTLVGFGNRLSVFFSWFWGYFTYTKNNRLITGNANINIKVPRKVTRIGAVD